MRKLLERFIKKFRIGAFAAMLLPILLLYIFCMGAALTPAVAIVYLTHLVTANIPIILYFLLMGFALASGFFAFGFTLMFVVPFVNWVLRLNYKPWSGSAWSFETVPWYYHNALTYLVRYTFLEFVTPTPLNTLFYRMMGMKIGKNVHIATTNISDPCLITLDDNVYIGGSTTIIGHYSTHGKLVLAPVHIKSNTTIGLRVSIMGDVVIGENALIKAHNVLLPKTRVEDGETV